MSDVERFASPRPTWVRYGVLLLVMFAAGSAYLTRHCLAVANTTIQEQLHLDNTQMGVVLGAYALGYLLLLVPVGWLGSRVGTRGALATLSVLWSACTIWTSSATSLVSLTLSRFAFGSAQAGLVPISAQIIKDWFPVHRRGLISALIAASMSIGGAVTMELTAWLLQWYDWRSVFRAYSLVGILWALAFYLFFRTYPKQHPWVNQAEGNVIQGKLPEASGFPKQTPQAEGRSTTYGDFPDGAWRQSDANAASEPLPAARSSARSTARPNVLAGITLLGICLQSFFRAAGYNLFVSFFPAFLEYAYQVDRTDAGRFTKWPLIGVIVGGMLGWLVVDALMRWTGNKWVSRSGVAITTLLITALLTTASCWTHSASSLVAVIAVAALFSGMAAPSAWAATIDVGGRNTAVVVGIMNMAGGLSGVLVTPLLGRMIDWIIQTDGNWNLVIYLHAAFYLLAALVWLFVFPEHRFQIGEEVPA